jgi:hypothetical protein
VNISLLLKKSTGIDEKSNLLNPGDPGRLALNFQPGSPKTDGSHPNFLLGLRSRTMETDCAALDLVIIFQSPLMGVMAIL